MCLCECVYIDVSYVYCLEMLALEGYLSYFCKLACSSAQFVARRILSCLCSCDFRCSFMYFWPCRFLLGEPLLVVLWMLLENQLTIEAISVSGIFYFWRRVWWSRIVWEFSLFIYLSTGTETDHALPIHREAPAFVEQATEQQILVTGIKVIYIGTTLFFFCCGGYSESF